VEVELRQVQVRADGLRDRMRAAIDMFGLLTFGLALLGLAVVATLAIVAFTQDETGVGMLFSALTIVALPMVGVAAWRAFSPLWGLARELRVLRRREAALYERLATEHAPPPAVHEEPGDTFVPPAGGRRVRRGGADSRLPPGNTPTGWRERPPTRPRRGRSAALWSLVGVGVFLLLLIIGIALGASTRT
jgi:hypothetical protein